MPITVLDPTDEGAPTERQRQGALGDLAGATVGLVDISKPRGKEFLDRVEEHLVDRGATVLRFAKPTFSKPAPADLRHEIAMSCDAVIQALAD
jgi:hypothetical protein